MELRDFIVTPIILLLVLGIAYAVRPHVTDVITRKYFLSALALKIIGAISVGFIYQFYYDGGDTFNFHTRGSRIIWEAFMDSPSTGLKLIFSDGEIEEGIYNYSSRIVFFRDSSSYFIIRLAAILDILTFSSYSATAVLFAVISFIGMWLLFITFYKKFPQLHSWFAIACFFVPSVFFWGSGLLKDTITLACVGSLVYATWNLFIEKKFSFLSIFLFVLSIWIILMVKKYILICFLPAALLWVFFDNFKRIKSQVLKILVAPFILIGIGLSAYLAVTKVGEGDTRYSLNNLAQTAKITAYDIGFYTGRDAGSPYSLGELDGTFQGMLKLAPQAINVTLFRPYFWEVKNPLMLLSSLESAVILVITIVVLIKSGRLIAKSLSDSSVLFCLVFSLTFAFAVGVSTFNFGTLVRYKIPLLPFYLIAISIIYNYSNRPKNVGVLESTE